ncbi:MAG: bifunctional diaminohydroxyphosphoribosylaminopyrimidine deaminase/5-amino-6-(5-phosphoribosylamino)uracil reductase RibD [Burkholderiales bacterium]
MDHLEDHIFMSKAQQLAELGLFTTTPNPRVGCIIVNQNKIVGEGHHRKAGENHAEIEALQMAGEKARGATAYVTLEPCNHHGRTPPCTDALIQAGITRVVAAMQDPNPLVSGQGLEKLRAANIEVTTGVMENEARELNIGFISRMTRNRPWVRMKIAASLDGKTALSNGHSQWITGPDARRDGHRWRARACAILTGGGTIKDDNPQLTVRDVETSRQPLRVIADSKLETPSDAKILIGGNVLIACAIQNESLAAPLRAKGAEIIVLPNASGKVELPQLLNELAKRGINELHVEAGYKLNGSLLREGLVDELLIYLAPCFLGDGAQGMANLTELADLKNKLALRIVDTRMVGSDLRLIAKFYS